MTPSRLRSDRATLPLQSDGSLRLAVVADTHSTPHPALVDQLTALQPHALLHAGDIGDLRVLEQLRAIAPVQAIRGNVDVRAPHLPDVLLLDIGAEATRMRILLVHIGVYGPRLRPEVARQARVEHASMVVCGHSHIPFIGRDRELTVFNPGSAGPRRFNLPIVFGAIEITPNGIELRHIDCETGLPWSPPRAPAARATA
jgi:uncharacterized protein